MIAGASQNEILPKPTNIRAKLIPELKRGANMKKKEPAKTSSQGGHINKAFQILPTQLLVDVASRKISASAYALYGFFHFWQGQKSELWWGVDSIAEATGFSEAKVKLKTHEWTQSDTIVTGQKP